MNERIEKLALECYQAPEFDYKKFAELIISECKQVSLNEIVKDSDIDAENDSLVKEYLKGNNMGVVDSIVAIQQHFFGVQE